jgi:hypothetical protein
MEKAPFLPIMLLFRGVCGLGWNSLKDAFSKKIQTIIPAQYAAYREEQDERGRR